MHRGSGIGEGGGERGEDGFDRELGHGRNVATVTMGGKRDGRSRGAQTGYGAKSSVAVDCANVFT